MKKFLIVLVFVIMMPAAVLAEGDTQQIIEKQQQAVDIENINNTIEKVVSPESKEIIPQFEPKQLLKDIASGKVSFNMKDIFSKIIGYFFKELQQNFSVIVKVVVLVLVFAVLQNLQSSFAKEGVGEVAFYSCYILLATILIKSFTTVLTTGKEVIDNLVLFMQAFIPTIFAILISTGNITTSAVLEPGILFGIEVLSTLIKSFLLPLILFYIVLAIINNISDKVQVSKFTDFVKNVGMWSLGIILTVFIAILTLQSTVTSAADGIGMRTAKFAVSNFIPIVGKTLSDAVDSVMGYSILLKNGIGIIGLIVIVMICLMPIIKFFALIVLYRLTAAVIQPVSDKRIVKCISEMANSLTYLTGAVISVAVMFLISVAILINAGNAAAALR